MKEADERQFQFSQSSADSMHGMQRRNRFVSIFRFTSSCSLCRQLLNDRKYDRERMSGVFNKIEANYGGVSTFER